jgi:hypothetical protein
MTPQQQLAFDLLTFLFGPQPHQQARQEQQDVPADPELERREQLNHYKRLRYCGWQIEELPRLAFTRWLYTQGRLS